MIVLALMPFLLYWAFVKSMDEWDWRFYVAAPLFILLESGSRWVLTSALAGHWDMPYLRPIFVHLCLALFVFYLLEKYGESDELAWPFIFSGGLVMVFLWQMGLLS